MFKRLTNSLMAPKEVAKYYGDSFWKAFLFFVILLLFLMIITFANLFTTSALTENMKKEIKKSFLKEDIAFVIEDSNLRNINNDHEYVYTNKVYETLYIVFTEDVKNSEMPIDGMSIVLAKDGVYLKVGAAIKIVEYSKYDYLHNIDFTDEELLADIKFWDNIFSVTESILKEYKPLTLIINTIYYFIYWTGTMMMFVLIISFFSKMRTSNLLSFGSIFKISIYNLAPFVICLIFSTVFNLGFLIYIGYIITSIYNFITINEVLKRLYLNRNEGE